MMNVPSEENKMAGLEDLEFFQTLQGWDSLMDEVPITPRCSSEKNLTDSEIFVGDILEEIELDNGFGLNVGCEWLTDRVDLASYDLEYSELVGLGLQDELSQLVVPANTTEDFSLNEDTQTSVSCLEALLTTSSSPSSPHQPLSPEQCVPDVSYLTPVASPRSCPVEIIPPVVGRSICQDTKIGVIISDSAKIAKTLQLKEKDSLNSKQYKVQPKVKTVVQRKRKQVQNRDAATRYRVKKKEEFDVLYQKAEELEQEHSELTKTVGSLAQEIEYLRKLMVEVYKNRLLKSIPTLM